MGYFFQETATHWSGFMRRYVSGERARKPNINFLPVINLNPADESCIDSTSLFVKKQAKHLNIPTLCITFDQSLFFEI